MISSVVKPRHVVILMDTSRSMKDRMSLTSDMSKLSFMKAVVTSTLGSLSEKDSIAVIRFGETAQLVNHPGAMPPYLWEEASADHVVRLIEAVNDIEGVGRSNWMKGFDFAFDLIESSLQRIIANDKKSCTVENIALLFFSDGRMNLPSGISDQEVVDFVSSRVKSVESRGYFHLHSFLYSLGNSDVKQVAKQISCAVDGYWKSVTSTGSPANVTNGYVTLFSTLMGSEFFYNYTAWSDPYIFVSSGEPGYTVSALVYNRDVLPPRFQGAVGMDISAIAAQEIYGGTMEETQQAIKEITSSIIRSNFNVTCDQQKIDLTYCETQSIRHLEGGDASICFPNTTVLQKVIDEVSTTIIPHDNSTNSTKENPRNIDEVIFDYFLNCSKAFIPPCPGKLL